MDKEEKCIGLNFSDFISSLSFCSIEALLVKPLRNHFHNQASKPVMEKHSFLKCNLSCSSVHDDMYVLKIENLSKPRLLIQEENTAFQGQPFGIQNSFLFCTHSASSILGQTETCDIFTVCLLLFHRELFKWF